MGQVQALTKTNFSSAVEEKGTPLLVDFWAPWCGPCRMIAPELEAVAQDLAGRVRVAKVNVDEEPELAEQFGVSSIPNLIIFRDGKPAHQIVGFTDRNALKKVLEPSVSAA